MSSASQSRELQVVDAQSVSTWIEPSPEDLRALRETIGKDCNDSQFRVFIAAARHLGLDPWARQVVPIVQQGRMTVQTTIDGFRRIAERSKLYGGQIGPYWCGEDGQWRDVWLTVKPPVAAKVGVVRRDFAEPMWGVARTAAYVKNTQPWQTMPDVMIAKVAESIALRKAFPAELSGAYTAEELDQARREGDDEPFVAQARIIEERSERGYEPLPATRSATPAKPSDAGKPWNGLADAPFRKRLNALGYKTVDQVREFLSNARDYFPNKPEGSREQAFAYLESVERDAERAAQADAGKMTEQGYEPPTDDATPDEPEGNEDIAYDLRTHPHLAGGLQP